MTQRSTRRLRVLASAILTSGIIAALIWWRFHLDITAARDMAAQGSTLIDTPCGEIEYQEAGTGLPLLAVHGSGGGFDQGMAFAAPLVAKGIRVIAMSRFGYLRRPMHSSASWTRWMCQPPQSWAGQPGRYRRCRWRSGIPIGLRC
jgi:2-hydroxy-6-oxonona-2,4-dienedioate hydrolase